MKKMFCIIFILTIVAPSFCWGKDWKPGSAQTKVDPLTSIEFLSAFQGLTEVQKNVIRGKISQEKYEEVIIPNGWVIDEMTYSRPNGKTRIAKNLTADLSGTGILKARLYKADGVPIQFVHVFICNNMAVGDIRSLIPTTVSPKSTTPTEIKPITIPIPIPLPAIETVSQKTEPENVFEKDSWDWYIGAGNYRSTKEGSDNNGYYGWTKFRYRPLWIESENCLIGIGPFAFLAGGEGVADKDYDYGWKEGVVGLTGKILAPHKDFDVDLGIGKLWNRGKWQDVVVNKQVDKIFLVATHANFYGRRDLDKDWFAKTEANLEFRIPFDTDVKRGDEADSQVIEVCLTQWLYDFHFGSTIIAPGFNFGGGYEWGNDDEAFIKIGPALEISSHNETIAGISVMNYKFQGDGQWAPIAAYISIDGIWRAYF